MKKPTDKMIEEFNYICQTQPDRDAVIAAIVLRDPSISIPAKAFYALLCVFAGKGSGCYPTHEKLALALGCSSDALTDWSKELKEKGYLDVLPRYNGKMREGVKYHLIANARMYSAKAGLQTVLIDVTPRNPRQPLPSGDRQPLLSGDRQPLPSGDRQPLPSGDRQPLPSGTTLSLQPSLKQNPLTPLQARGNRRRFTRHEKNTVTLQELAIGRKCQFCKLTILRSEIGLKLDEYDRALPNIYAIPHKFREPDVAHRKCSESAADQDTWQQALDSQKLSSET